MPRRFSPSAASAAVLLAQYALLAPLPAAAQGTSEQRAACTGDAMRLCLSAVPDVGRITSCMKSHYGELSPRCQATFHEDDRNEAKPAAPPRKLAEEPAKAAPAQTAAKAIEPPSAPREQARIVPRETRRDATREATRDMVRGALPHPRVARATPVEAGQPAEGRAAGHHRGPHQLAAREPARDLPIRDLPARDLPAREPAEAPLAAAPAAPLPPAYPTDVPDARRAPPYPVIAGGPIYGRPPLVAGLGAPNGSLAAACRAGLIDAYTCGHTIPTLGLDE